MPASAFQIHAADHPALARTLRDKLQKLADVKASHLASAQDWPDFKQRLGVIQGLTLAIEECVEAEKKHGD